MIFWTAAKSPSTGVHVSRPRPSVRGRRSTASANQPKRASPGLASTLAASDFLPLCLLLLLADSPQPERDHVSPGLTVCHRRLSILCIFIRIVLSLALDRRLRWRLVPTSSPSSCDSCLPFSAPMVIARWSPCHRTSRSL